ncbi:MAG: hypothetical protein A2536_09285 [Candidatus Firestonebacteria bacterium RIFOXYD2_FULL_39_29]|nr:MAG: hypothetical protein A2536_09285 [Candidatus Firestonebacteria bacterium RIFOXYD2_FULL_39_29]
MKIIILVAIVLISICTYAFGISINNDYANNAIEYSELCDQDEVVYFRNMCILADENKGSRIYFKSQTIKENLVKNFFHPPR